MEDVQHRFARELADAIATAVAQSAEVESCRERARAAGFDLKVTLEATVGLPRAGPPRAERRRRAATDAEPPRHLGDHRQRPALPALAAHRRRRSEGRGSELTPEQRLASSG